MVQGTVEIVSMNVDLLRELALESGKHVVELKCVRAQVNPLRLSCEDGEGLTGPKTIGFTPDCYVRGVLLCVSVKTFHVALPLKRSSLSAQVLKNDLPPFGVSDFLSNLLDSVCVSQLLNIEVSGVFNVLREFLISSVVSVIKWASIKTHNSSESVHVVDCSGSCNLGTEPMSSNGGHRDLVLVHVPNYVV